MAAYTGTDGDVRQPPAVSLHLIRLLLPEEELQARLVGGAAELSAYINTIKELAVRYWASQTTGTAQARARGLSVAVGVKPNGQSRAWSEAVGGVIPAEALQEFDRLVAQLPAPRVILGPIAFALHLGLFGADEHITFPEMPTAWVQFCEIHGRGPILIPDGLFLEMWPDTE